MPLFASFIGPAYEAKSPIANSERADNIYLETTASQGAAKQAFFYGTPGTRRLLTADGGAGASGGRGSFSQDGRTWTVVGGDVYEVSIAGATATRIGSVPDDGKPVFFASNGRGGEQLAICGGGQLAILDLVTGVFTPAVALPHTNAPTWLAFIDGYFLLGERDTIRVWFCNLEDGLIWDALDFFARSQTSDNIVGGVVFRNRVWTFGSLTSEVFYDSGDSDNPFVPYPGSVMQEGLVSLWAVGVQGESVVWMAQDAEGSNRIVRATDYAPTVISTPGIAAQLASCSTLADVEVAIYEQIAHPFAVWTCPSYGPAGASFGWDAREQQWHTRSTRDAALGVDKQWIARGLCSPGAAVLCGGWQSDGLFLLDLDAFEDDGGMIVRTRRAPYLSAENQWLFLDQVELGMQAGVGLVTGQGSDPKVGLRISRDGAHTFDFAGFANLGAIGDYLERAFWVMLGRARADRLVLEVYQSDPVRCVWGPGLWLRVTPGTGML